MGPVAENSTYMIDISFANRDVNRANRMESVSTVSAPESLLLAATIKISKILLIFIFFVTSYLSFL